jgi:hypothetical protein
MFSALLSNSDLAQYAVGTSHECPVKTSSTQIRGAAAYYRNGADLGIISGKLTRRPSRSVNTIQKLFDLVLEVSADV